MRAIFQSITAKRRTGAAIVEHAIVLPVVLLVFAGMIEISRVLLLQHSADTAAYEGARCAMVPGATSNEAHQAASHLVNAAGLKSVKISVSPATITEETSLITVRVEVPIAENAWIFQQWFRSNSVVSETTLICERPPVIQLTGLPEINAKSNQMKGKQTGL
jgi:Flp pilus assembly protein TadG